MGEAVPCKHEDLSSDPRTYGKADSVVQDLNSSVSVMRWEAETGEYPGAHRPAAWCLLPFNEADLGMYYLSNIFHLIRISVKFATIYLNVCLCAV